MPWLAILTGARSFLAKVPWQVYAAIAAAVAMWFAVHAHQSAVEHVRSTAYAQGASDTQKTFLAAQAKADAAAAKQKQDMEAHYAALASQKDQQYEIELASARDATARYIATHSVPARAQGRPGTTVATADNHGASVPQGVPADTFVLVSPDDVQACSAAVAYSVQAHDWALGLEKKP